MSSYELWLDHVSKDENTELWTLEDKNGVKLFETKHFYWTARNKICDHTCYHVWAGDEWIALMDYIEAYRTWERRAKEARRWMRHIGC